MRAAPIALGCWLLPTAAVLITYTVSASQGQVPTCFPFLEGCTSISGAARRDPSIHIFRAMMLPTATLIGGYWLLVRAWLGHLGETGRARDWITVLGLVGALFMVLYVVFLGTDGRAYELMRRYGVTVYFSFTALAQLVLAARLNRLPGEGQVRVGHGVIHAKKAFGATMLLLGLANIPLANYFPELQIDNSIAWNFALLMHGYFGLTAIAWHRAGFHVATRM
ncbi:MAG TPA: hypothetical protein PLS34_00745 [Gammaproteobacteria bacterium]|nr:hypothetical protein [Gammaproteobacteria bacterium]